MLSGDSVFPLFCVLVILLEISFWAIYMEIRGLVRPHSFRLGAIILHVVTTVVVFILYIILGAEATNPAWIFAITGARLIDITPLWVFALEGDKSQNKK